MILFIYKACFSLCITFDCKMTKIKTNQAT